jgi:MFS family permease
MLGRYKNTILASLGVGFEYYDFIIYALMGVYLGDIFFQGDHSTNSFYYFSIFAIGYFFRPLGGVIFGLISDKYGRKKSFSILILAMAIATFAIGILPTHKEFLHISVLILIFARILQGVALGGELPNALVLVHESNARNPVHSGILTSSATAGNILALLVLFSLSTFLTKDEIIKWGWRIPFLFGGALAMGCYFLRQNIIETDEFLKIKNEVSKQMISYPLKLIISKDLYKILFAAFLSGCVGSFIAVFFYIPTYIGRYYHYEVKEVYYFMTAALIFSLVIAPLVGVVAGHITKRKIIIITSLSIILFVQPVFALLGSGGEFNLIAFMFLYELVATILYVTNLALLADLFDVKVRSTAISFCYNIGTALASLSPVLITFLIKSGNDPSILVSFFTTVGILMPISLVALMRITKGGTNDR